MWEIIRDLNKQGMKMLLTTHYMDEVEYLCDRIGIMDGGRLIRLGTLAQLRQEHDQGLVMKQIGVRWKYKFFPTREEPDFYRDGKDDKNGRMVIPSN
ncbi:MULTISPECIES: hypothetical protein [unclassified Microcoleus]|uniref:hypothetical protein n=2 Tax=Microcoleus TaxID=44471 RepID=UPI002FD1B209